VHRTQLLPVLAACLALAACNRTKPTAPAASKQGSANRVEAPEPLLPDEDGGTAEANRRTLTLPTNFGKRTGDLDEMVRERAIRALVIIDPIGFFYLSGRPRGIQYEVLEGFEKFANRKLKTGKLPVKVVFLPMRPDQLEAALTQGVGDLIAQGVVITPEREQRLAFSRPLLKNVSQVVLTGSSLADVSSFDGLAGTPIYANPLTTYYDNLQKLNDLRRSDGKPALDVRPADKNLSDHDLIEMVNAGLIPATVAHRERAELWAKVLPNVKVHPELQVARGGELAWVMRKNTPRLKALVDEFLEDHAAGSLFGNTLLHRYLQDTKWIKDSLAPEEMRKFVAYSQFFKKYASEYNFDYLMIAAQGYQESLLDQDKKSPAGAVGVMQVIPKFAAADPINIPDVRDAEGNIHAGAKMLHHIAVTRFNEPGIDRMNKTLFALASYNAGPNRIARLRTRAKEEGLDPNVWFGNVELEAAKDIGQETVNYVGNIYKYYVAYKLAVLRRPERAAAVQRTEPPFAAFVKALVSFHTR
jgi:membrane-bound lytic murein transglycosylase MltF